jgi:hypothetical protein
MPDELNQVDRKIAATLLDSGAVNFEALGRTIAAVGPSAVMLDDGWERFCGSNFRLFRWRAGLELEQLSVLREVGRELRR